MGTHSVTYKHRKRRILSAPVMINLELTAGCNMKCRHCYNFWREDSTNVRDKITIEQMDKIIDQVIEAKVFHLVLTGGEPMMNMEALEHGIRRCSEKGISTSVNSNLMLATPEKIQKLKDAGLDHVLTSLNSYRAEVNDYMVHQKNALERIVRGIKFAIAGGIRVSANMIISEPNKHDVYETARLCSELGVQRLFATRLVPSVNVADPTKTDLNLDRTSALYSLDELLRAKEDFGIGIGTLISYPLCALGDLQKYKDFVGRGCPAQTGTRMSLNADGQTHACTHEEVAYGNIFEIGIKEAFKRMHKWHDGSYLFDGCADCEYIDICGSGCRMASAAYYKAMDAKDPLWTGHEHIGVPYKMEIPTEIKEGVITNQAFVIPKRIRFREEDGFYTVNIRWADTITVENDVAEFMMKMQSTGQSFTLKDVSFAQAHTTLLHLIFKEAVEPVSDDLKQRFNQGRLRTGASINPELLPANAVI